MNTSKQWIQVSLVSMVILLGASLVGAATTYVWTGANSGNWSDGGNWTNGVAPTSTSSNDTVWLTSSGTPPSNQDITGLFILKLIFNTNSVNYTVGGKPITLDNLLCYDDNTTARTNTLNCDVIMALNNIVWAFPQRSLLLINGTVGEINGSKKISANGIGTSGYKDIL